MSYPTDPASGYRPGAGPGGGTGQQPPPDPYTQVLPPGAYGGGYPANAAGLQPGEYEPYEPPGGYGPPGYGPPGYGPPPDKSRKWAFIFGGILVLVIFGGVGFYAAYALTQDSPQNTPGAAASQPPVLVPSDAPPSDLPSDPPPSDGASPSPSGQAVPGAVFADPELRDFAGNGVQQKAQCQEQPTTGFAGVTEVVSCQFTNFTVRYLKFESDASKDQYSNTVRDGLGGQVQVQRDSFWANRQGQRQGRFVAGSQAGDTRQYVYWNSDRAAVSGELVIAGSRRGDAEQAWRGL